jgi:hypothetical protein
MGSKERLVTLAAFGMLPETLPGNRIDGAALGTNDVHKYTSLSVAQQGIQFTTAVEGVEIVATANVPRTNENLRYGTAPMRALNHFWAPLRLLIDPDDFCLYLF